MARRHSPLQFGQGDKIATRRKPEITSHEIEIGFTMTLLGGVPAPDPSRLSLEAGDHEPGSWPTEQ